MAAAPGGAELPGIPPSRARATWSWYVTLANCLQQRAAVARATLDHQVVIFDRGPLDLAVRMEVLYHAGVERQRRLIARAAPLPQLAFHLDIPAELSLARKQDIWSPVELNEHARLYRELAPRFGVRSLDGQRPIEDIAAEVSGAVWRLVR
jgi:thymidylate kinase